MHPGELIEIESEEELDRLLTEDSESLTVLLASLTWCRPCKTLAKPLQVCWAQSNNRVFLFTHTYDIPDISRSPAALLVVLYDCIAVTLKGTLATWLGHA